MKLFKYTIWLLLLLASVGFSKEKYFIYFKDKGELQKSALLSQEAKEEFAKMLLSEKSIERRKKKLGDDFLQISDLPINQTYIDELLKTGLKIERRLKWFNAVTSYLNDDEIEEIKKFDFVKEINPVRKLKYDKNLKAELSKSSSVNSSTKTYTYDYGPSLSQNELSQIPEVHDMGIDGEGIVVGILDTGFDWELHESLKDRNVIAEYDFVYNDNETSNEDADASYQHNHGTSVFSILAGFSEGKIIGPAFNSEFLLAKTEYVPTETHVEEDNYAAALEWMDSIGVDITTSSLGYSTFDSDQFSYTYEDMDGETTIVTKAAELAFDKGIVVITSAGNEGNSSWRYITAPGDGFNTLTIGAVSYKNIIASFSSRGPTYDGRIKPEVVAQGVSDYAAAAGTTNGYSFGSGTSYSGPIAAGIASLLLSTYPHLNNEQLRSIFINTGDQALNPDTIKGYGLLSALNVITYPNLSKVNDSYFLNKIFADSISSSLSKVLLNIDNLSGSEWQEIELSRSTDLIYSTELTGLTTGVTTSFYFELLDANNNLISREPSEGYYNFIPDNLIIDYDTSISGITSLPDDYKLWPNYPNPFNAGTKIQYSIPEYVSNAGVKIILYNSIGMEIAELFNGRKGEGVHTYDFLPIGLASGVYFYTIQISNSDKVVFQKTNKMILLK